LFFKILKFSSLFRANLLVEISATDFLNKSPAFFELVYIFRSIFFVREFTLSVPIGDKNLCVNSVTLLYENAN